MVKRKAKKGADLGVGGPGGPSKPAMIFVLVYPTEHEGLRLDPGVIVEVAEEDFAAWTRDLERAQARMVMSQEDALALSASILDGSFVLSPEISQMPHPVQHGGFGKAKKAIEGDLSLR